MGQHELPTEPKVKRQESILYPPRSYGKTMNSIRTMRRKELGLEIQSATNALCQSYQSSFEATAQIKLVRLLPIGNIQKLGRTYVLGPLKLPGSTVFQFSLCLNISVDGLITSYQ